MQTAALQAERTFVTGVEIRLADVPVPGPPPQVTIQAQTGLADLEEPNRWRADLAIVVRPADEQRPLPYQIAISVSGIFRVVAEMEQAAARRFAFVNGMSISYQELPFGGTKDSGLGCELSAEGVREFCNAKTIWKA